MYGTDVDAKIAHLHALVARLSALVAHLHALVARFNRVKGITKEKFLEMLQWFSRRSVRIPHIVGVVVGFIDGVVVGFIVGVIDGTLGAGLNALVLLIVGFEGFECGQKLDDLPTITHRTKFDTFHVTT